MPILSPIVTSALTLWKNRAHYRFRPALLPTIAVLALLPLFLHLSAWQEGKAHSKILAQNLYKAHAQEPYGSLPSTLHFEDRFRRVILRGQFVPEGAFLLDNQLHQGQAGFHHLVPMRLDEGRLILINRGWLPFSGDRQKLPEPTTPSGSVVLRGEIVPIPSLKIDPQFAPKWGESIWAVVDMPLIQQHIRGEWANAMVRETAEELVGDAPRQDAQKWVRDWQAPDFNIDQHKSYAGQWKIIAVAMVVVWLVGSFRRNNINPSAQ